MSKRMSAIFLLVALLSICVAPAALASAAKPALRRADFRITGASCVVCLRRIGKTFRSQPGVLKADVSVFRPYWSIVIYDSNQTSMKKIIDSISNERVKVEDLEETKISEVPEVIIPKHATEPQLDRASAKSAAPSKPQSVR